MIINIIKNPEVFENLKQYNRPLFEFSKRWKYARIDLDEYNFDEKLISYWFNPYKIRDLGISRTYPEMCSVQYRPEYSIILHCSNYLPLFLINLLYQDRKNILIEDIGGGIGWFFYYLNKLGFDNFHLWDDFSQLPEEASQDFITYFNLPAQINNASLKPIITNNVGVPAFIVREVNPELELIFCYTSRSLESQSKDYLSPKGFVFLCKDSDDLNFTYCQEDKYEEFIEKIKPYEDK